MKLSRRALPRSTVIAESIEVEVVVALPDRQALIRLSVPIGATASDAIAQSGVVGDFPELGIDQCPLAIWGKIAGPRASLKNGDRVEVLRPLTSDPREARRALAIEGQVMGGVAIDD